MAELDTWVDVVATTLRDLGGPTPTNLMTTMPRFEFWRMLKSDKKPITSGYGLQFTVQWRHSGAAKHVAPGEADSIQFTDTFTNGTVPWRRSQTYWPVTKEEVLANKSPAKIVDLVKGKRNAAMVSMWELFEQALVTKPANDADDKVPFGIPYWVVKNATEGFNGGDPAGIAAGAAGLLTATYSRWKNYTGTYVNVTHSDLLDKMRGAAMSTDFRAPQDIADYRTGVGQKNRILVNKATKRLMFQAQFNQNDNLGRDLYPFEGQVSFNGSPVIYMPKLDDDTQNPVYMLDYGSFYPVFMPGDFMSESGPHNLAAGMQHRVVVTWLDCTWNLMCDDRRRQAVFYVA